MFYVDLGLKCSGRGGFKYDLDKRPRAESQEGVPQDWGSHWQAVIEKRAMTPGLTMRGRSPEVSEFFYRLFLYLMREWLEQRVD